MKKVYQLIVLGTICLSISSCLKNTDNASVGEFAPQVLVPVVTTIDIASVTADGAISGGSILDSSSDLIIARGVCYGTDHNPTLESNSMASITSGANFVSKLTGLTEHVTYYVRAFATNSAGTGYGNELSFIPTVALGQNYQGGIVFYLDGRGEHGLIVSPLNLIDTTWGCDGMLITGGADLTTIGGGAQNTLKISQQCAALGIAARQCYDLVLNGYSDWYLPSRDELFELYKQRRSIGSLPLGNYWSSTQSNASFAYMMNSSIGSLTLVSKGVIAKVRPIRAF